MPKLARVAQDEPFEAALACADAPWAQVTRTQGMSPLQHDFQHGLVWYRGHFTATGNEAAVTLRTKDKPQDTEFHQHYLSDGDWLNGVYLGAYDAPGAAPV